MQNVTKFNQNILNYLLNQLLLSINSKIMQSKKKKKMSIHFLHRDKKGNETLDF